jgi:hypothetical protein
MLTANDFLEQSAGDPRFDKPLSFRVLEALPSQPAAVKERLVREFMEIVCNPEEQRARRINSIHLLCFYCGTLGIKGSIPISEALSKLVEAEFLAGQQLGIHEELERPKGRSTATEFMRLNFLRALLTTIVLINPVLGLQTCREVAKVINRPRVKVWLRNLIAQALRSMGQQ